MANLSVTLNLNSMGDFVFSGGIPIRSDNAQLIEDLRKANGDLAPSVAVIVANALHYFQHDYTRKPEPFEDTLVALLIACVRYPHTRFEATSLS